MAETMLALNLQVSLEDGLDEEVDILTRGLLSEILDQPVESAELVEGQAQSGAKGDPVTIGSIALVVLPTLLPKLVEVIQAWVARGRGRQVKFKGMINGQVVEFEGTNEDLKALVQMLKTQ